MTDHSWKEKRCSADSVHQKVHRNNSQTKRRISPSELTPRKRLSMSEPKFQRRISLTELPGPIKISPNDSPPYQKLESSNGQVKHHTRRKQLTKALTLTNDPADLSPPPSNRLRRFFHDSSLLVDDDHTYSSGSLSPNQTPKYFSAEAVTPAKTPSRESLQVFPEIVFEPANVEETCSLFSYESPIEVEKEQKTKSISVSNTGTPTILTKIKVASEKPSQLYRQLSQSSESQSSHLKVTPTVPLASTLDRLGPIDSLPQLIRRASCKPTTPIDTSSLIPLLSKSSETHLTPPSATLTRQLSISAESPSNLGYSTKTKETSRKYERLK